MASNLLPPYQKEFSEHCLLTWFNRVQMFRIIPTELFHLNQLLIWLEDYFPLIMKVPKIVSIFICLDYLWLLCTDYKQAELTYFTLIFILGELQQSPGIDGVTWGPPVSTKSNVREWPEIKQNNANSVRRRHISRNQIIINLIKYEFVVNIWIHYYLYNILMIGWYTCNNCWQWRLGKVWDFSQSTKKGNGGTLSPEKGLL